MPCTTFPQDEAELFPPFAPGYGIEWLESMLIPQSLLFMHDMLKAIYTVCLAVGWSAEKPLTLLDVGATSAAGSHLLQQTLRHLCGINVAVTALESDPRFARYARHKFPHVQFLSQDVATLDATAYYDLVICSQTLSQVAEPHAFVQHLRRLARAGVILYAPFEEEPLIPGHLHRFDAAAIGALPGVCWGGVLTSLGWRTAANSRTFLAVCLAETAPCLAQREQIRAALTQEYGVDVLPVSSEPVVAATPDAPPPQTALTWRTRLSAAWTQLRQTCSPRRGPDRRRPDAFLGLPPLPLPTLTRQETAPPEDVTLPQAITPEEPPPYPSVTAFRRALLLPHVTLPCDTLEIGAFTAPTLLPAETRLRILDFYSTAELRQQAQSLGRDPDSVLPVDYLCRSDRYDEEITGQFDLMIANHVWEHIVNPVDWLNRCARLLRPGGILFLVLPDKKYNFDRFRSDTTLAHLLVDYFLPQDTAQAMHALEPALLYDRDYIGQSNEIATRLEAGFLKRALQEWHPGMHCHVFQAETFEESILKPLLALGITDYGCLAFADCRQFGEFAVVLQKGGPRPQVTAEAFFRPAYDSVGL